MDPTVGQKEFGPYCVRAFLGFPCLQQSSNFPFPLASPLFMFTASSISAIPQLVPRLRIDLFFFFLSSTLLSL